MKSIYICLFLGVVAVGCSSNNESSQQAPALPEHVQNLENVTVISPQDFPSDNVNIHLDQVFTETEDVFFGYAGNIAVDDSGRLFIETGSEMGQTKIYVFNSDGQFIKQIGRYGRGPGEFELIQGIQASKDKLFVYENFEMHVFNLSDLSFSHSFIIKMEGVPNESPIRGLRPGNSFFVQNDSSFLFLFEPNLRQRITVGDHHIYHNFVSSGGAIDSVPVLKQRDFTFFNQTEDGSLPRYPPFAMPYIPSSLTTISRDGRISSNWNEDFLIKIYDFSGNYLKSIYMPIQPAPLPREHALNLGRYKERIDVLEDAETPGSWPVIHRMYVDDQNRLWTATITESDSTFKWFVFDENLIPLSTFDFKGTRNNRQAWLPKDLIIKNSHLYQIQPYSNRKAAEVYRYKIDFEEE